MRHCPALNLRRSPGIIRWPSSSRVPSPSSHRNYEVDEFGYDAELTDRGVDGAVASAVFEVVPRQRRVGLKRMCRTPAVR